MSSASPGHVISPGDPEDDQQHTPIGVRAPARAAGTPVRTVTQKRAWGSPSSPAPGGALALLGSLTESVRSNAARGLRALSDSIERPRAHTTHTDSDASAPPSPTDAVKAVKATPAHKRRRTALTDAKTRRSHADWRGTQWDYSGAMKDDLFYRVGDTGPSAFTFPRRPPGDDDARETTMEAEGASEPHPPARPPSAMSTASAPAALSTPSARPKLIEAPPPEGGDEGAGWVLTAPEPGDDDPFMPARDADMSDTSWDVEPFVDALRAATAMLSPATVGAPDACGALLAFQARLRALDPQGNFVAHCPAGEHATASIRELTEAVADIAATQRDCMQAISALHDRMREPRTAPPPHPARSAQPERAASPPPQPTPVAPAAAQGPMRPAPTPPAPRARQPADAPPAPTRAVGRHDPRRAVFCPSVPFGGRIPSPASADGVRRLNSASYLVRDAVNAALRDRAVETMNDAPAFVQVAAVNWTERGNLCMITHERFTAAELLLHADAAAGAAELGPGWRASRDVPVHKVAICNVPTQRTDGALFTEDEVLDDLRAHSSAFNSLALADSVERASWISRADRRALKDRSTLVVNLATAEDAARLLAMKHCLFALGCPCEPDTFQPRERERICQRCWNPQARHRERDYACRERCRLCGGRHAEEDHTCAKCDVLARPCVHIPLHCVNCGGRHAADDSACEYRRRSRGTAPSAPPMSAPATERRGAQSGQAPGKKKGKSKVRVLDPHEPFPDDLPPPSPPPAPATAPPPTAPSAGPSPASNAAEATPTHDTPARAKKKRAAARRKAAAVVASAPATPPDTPSPDPAPAARLQAAVGAPEPAPAPAMQPVAPRSPTPDAEPTAAEMLQDQLTHVDFPFLHVNG